MSNTPSLNKPGPRGDHGIGLCLACCNELVLKKRTAAPEFAITWIPVPAAGPIPVVVPSCYDHIVKMAEGPALLLPGKN